MSTQRLGPPATQPDRIPTIEHDRPQPCCHCHLPMPESPYCGRDAPSQSSLDDADRAQRDDRRVGVPFVGAVFDPFSPGYPPHGRPLGRGRLPGARVTWKSGVGHVGSTWITPPSTGGSCRIDPTWQRRATGASGRSGSAGIWTSPLCRAKARGGLCLVLSLNTASP
jgi:hypothetical protein